MPYMHSVWVPFNFNPCYPVKTCSGNRNGVATSTHVRILLEQISYSVNILRSSNRSSSARIPFIRFKLVPAFEYFLTLLKIVLGEGGFRSGNLC